MPLMLSCNRREGMAAEAEPRGGKRQHAPQLPAAQNSDGGFGLQNRSGAHA